MTSCLIVDLVLASAFVIKRFLDNGTCILSPIYNIIPMTCESSVNKILLTGSSGFIATHLHKCLLECGHKVVPIDIQTRPSNPPHQDTLRIDVNDTESIKDIILRHEIDVIIHAAALTHVKYSWEQEFLYNTTNVQGTASILEAIRNSRRTPRYYITLSPLVC